MTDVDVTWHARTAERVAEEVGADAVRKATDRALGNARDFAPRFTGDYVSGLTSEYGVEGGEPVGRVMGTHWSSWLIEVGTPTSPAFAPLRRSVEALGLDVT